MNDDQPHPNAATRDALLDYLSRPAPGYAVLIAAPWGAGKTYLVKNIIEEINGKSPPLYVSLFGAGTEAGARAAIMRSIIGEGSARLETGAKLLGGLAKKFTGVDLQLSITEFARFVDQPDTVIFDDLERSGIEQSVLSGLINDLVERDGKHVVLLANEARLWPDGNDQKEKIVGLTLPVVADVERALPRFLDEIADPSQLFLKGETGLILETFRLANHHNLRSLRQTLFDFHRLFVQLDEDFRKTKDGMREFLGLYLALALEVKAGGASRNDLRLRYGTYDAKKPEFEVLRNLSQKYDRQDILYGDSSVLPAHLSERLLLDGAVVANEIRSALIASGRFSRPEEADWQTVWWAARRDPTEVQSCYAAMEKRFEGREYLEPGIMLHVFYQRMRAREMGLTSASLDEIEQECDTYIDDLANDGRLARLEPRRAIDFDYTGYGGLGYPRPQKGEEADAQTMAFWRLQKKLKVMQVEAFNSGLRTSASQVVSLIADGQIDQVAEYLWRTENGGEGTLRHAPVLAHVDPVELAAAIAQNSGEKLWTLGHIFKERYQSPGTELDAELQQLLGVVKALHDEAGKRAASSPVHAWQIRSMTRSDFETAMPTEDQHGNHATPSE